MTPENLERHKRLQPIFKEKIILPYCYDLHYCERQKKLSVDYPCVICSTFRDNMKCNSKIILPLPIDPVNPERGLWGMVDWKRFVRRILSDGKIEILIPEANICYIADPETALLKALCEQEGV